MLSKRHANRPDSISSRRAEGKVGVRSPAMTFRLETSYRQLLFQSDKDKPCDYSPIHDMTRRLTASAEGTDRHKQYKRQSRDQGSPPHISVRSSFKAQYAKQLRC